MPRPLPANCASKARPRPRGATIEQTPKEPWPWPTRRRSRRSSSSSPRTDFVAKSEEFTALAQALADDVAASGKDAVQDHVATIEDLRISLKENIEVGRIERFEASDGEVLDTYLHRQNDRGVNGVVVHLAGGSSELAHDVALHIASSRPKYLTRDEVPVDEVEQERATLETLSRNEGKPEAALERIVTGRLDGWYRQHTLLEQKFVKDEKRSIAEVLGDVTIKGFAQVEIGAG